MFYPVSINLCLNNCLNLAHFFHHTVFYSLGNIFANSHSSTFAWKIPWTEEPGRLQSMGSLESDTTEWLHFYFSLSCIGEGNGNPLQCSCLENPRDRGAEFHGQRSLAGYSPWCLKESDMTEDKHTYTDYNWASITFLGIYIKEIIRNIVKYYVQ